jgi:hypothetical protein
MTKRMIRRGVIMSLAKNIIVATALTGILAMAHLGAVQAGDATPVWRTMKPLHAISFDVGRKHVLSYFLRKEGLCELTMMVTDRPDEASDGDEIPTLATARFKAAIDGGKTARLDTPEGKSLEYACTTDAHAMSVMQMNQVAVASPPRRNSK